MTNYDQHREEMMKDPEFYAAYEAIVREERLAEAFILARRKKGLSQKELADITGVPQARISKIERGNGNPTISTLDRLASGLNMTLEFALRPAGE